MTNTIGRHHDERTFMTEQRVLITGSSGVIGKLMRTRMRKPGRILRLLDIAEPAPAEPGEGVEILTGSVTDADLVTRACDGVDAIIHLGGVSREAGYQEILDVNVTGTHTVLEAARAAGISRVVLASSNHAVGFRTTDESGAQGIPGDASPRPDTYYGFSKAALESLGSLYHSRFGMDVICIRIGSCFERPWDVRGLSTWLSPDDCARLFEACLSAPKPGYRVVWGVSGNTRRVFSLAEAEALGYQPQDDAEVFAAEIADGKYWQDSYVGGGFTTTPLGEPNPL
jgi:NAD(P)-dependent dehydrogenase (short-subunit alcohol dehydrogenase family)